MLQAAILQHSNMEPLTAQTCLRIASVSLPSMQTILRPIINTQIQASLLLYFSQVPINFSFPYCCRTFVCLIRLWEFD